MINSLTRMSIKGAIWYQGEHNAGIKIENVLGLLLQDLHIHIGSSSKHKLILLHLFPASGW